MRTPKVEQQLIMARYLVDRHGLENAAKGMVVYPPTLKAFIETGEIKSTKIGIGLSTFFFETIAGELDAKKTPEGVKNYDSEDLEDFKGGTRKGGAGGGSNNAFRTSVGETYL